MEGWNLFCGVVGIGVLLSVSGHSAGVQAAKSPTLIQKTMPAKSSEAVPVVPSPSPSPSPSPRAPSVPLGRFKVITTKIETKTLNYDLNQMCVQPFNPTGGSVHESLWGSIEGFSLGTPGYSGGTPNRFTGTLPPTDLRLWMQSRVQLVNTSGGYPLSFRIASATANYATRRDGDHPASPPEVSRPLELSTPASLIGLPTAASAPNFVGFASTPTKILAAHATMDATNDLVFRFHPYIEEGGRKMIQSIIFRVEATSYPRGTDDSNYRAVINPPKYTSGEIKILYWYSSNNTVCRTPTALSGI